MTKTDMEHREEWEAENAPPSPFPPHWEFQPQKKYVIKPKTRCCNVYAEESVMRKKYMCFLRDEGIHHIFASVAAGWLECFTDVQLTDYEVKDFRGDRTWKK